MLAETIERPGSEPITVTEEGAWLIPPVTTESSATPRPRPTFDFGELASGNGMPENCPAANWDYSSPETQLLNNLNAYRVQNNVAPLTRSWALSKSTQWKVVHQIKNQYMAHDDPPPVNRSFGDRLADCGVDSGVYIGENLLGNCPPSACDPLVVFQNSPAHDGILLGPLWTEVGITYIAGSKIPEFKHMWAMDFSITNPKQGWSVCANVETSDGTLKVTVSDINYVVGKYYTTDVLADLDQSGLVTVTDILIASQDQYFTYCSR